MQLESVNQTDGVSYQNKETVSRWHLAFRRNNEAFQSTCAFKRRIETSLPPLLDRNPELAKCINTYAKATMNQLSYRTRMYTR
jgi:hypothetical protein